MRNRILAAMLGVALIGAAPKTPDDRIIDVGDVENVASLMREMGYQADVQIAKDGQPNIMSKMDGNEFQLVFYGCKNKKGCDSFDFYSWFKKEAFFTPELANEWNTKNRFLKVNVDADGDLAEYLSVSGVGNMTFANFKDYFVWYRVMDGELGRFLLKRSKELDPKGKT